MHHRLALPSTPLILCLCCFGSLGTTLIPHRPDKKFASGLAERFRKAPYNHANYDAFIPVGDDLEAHIPKGYKVIRISRVLGSGEACYRRASEALLSWDMHKGCSHSGIVVDKRPVSIGTDTPATIHHRKSRLSDVEEHSAHSERQNQTPHRTSHLGESGGGGLVFTFALSAPGLWSVNPCRITHQIYDRPLLSKHPRKSPGKRVGLFSSVGYATLEGHWLEGAEVMTVRIDGEVGTRGGTPNGLVTFELSSISRGRRGTPGKLLFPLVARTQRAFFQDQVDAMTRAASGSGS